MIDKVILVNTIQDQRYRAFVGPGDSNLGLITIRDALIKKGFDNILLLPSKPIKEESNYPTLFKDLHEAIRDERSTLIGITAMTDAYSKFEYICKIIDENWPLALRIGGGPHLQREKWNPYQDPIESALHNKLVHAVNFGGASPTINFIIDYGGDSRFISDIPGLYKLDDKGLIIGHGEGSYPEVDIIPCIANRVLLKYKEKEVPLNERDILFDDTCGNFCDYCAIYKSKNNLNVELAKRTLDTIIKDKEVTFLHLVDSNPFEQEKIQFYQEIFQHIDNKNSKVIKSGFVDPALLADESYSQRLTQILLENSFIHFFIGRECVSEENAELIGRRYRGKIRTQGQLDREYEAIKGFIKTLEHENMRRSSAGEHPFMYQVEVSYIFVPHDKSKSSQLRFFNEMKELHEMSRNFLRVRPQFFSLNPFPGTKLKKRLLYDISNPELFSEHQLCGNAWRYLGPGSKVLDKAMTLERVYIEGKIGDKKYYDYLERAVNRHYP